MGIIDIVEIGRQGLTANRDALQTTSNNISNANTPGYSRQRTVMHANENAQVGTRRMGGVHIQDVIRVHDGFVQNQLLDEAQKLGAAKTRTDNMHRLESLISGDSSRVGDRVNEFFNAFRELSANPETPGLRHNVVQTARSTVDAFRNISDSLDGLRKDMDAQVDVQIAQVNEMTKELAQLNGSLAQLHARGETPLELADRREQILRDLSQKIGFQLCYDDQDHANIIASGGIGTLVNGTEWHKLSVERTAERGEKGAGSLSIFVEDGGVPREITKEQTQGEIGGLLYVRDNVVTHALRQLDDAAFRFATEVNAIHQEGVGLDGVGERDLFKIPKERQGAAETIDLTDPIKLTSENLAVGQIRAPGDNRIALQIADLQKKKVFSDNPDAFPTDRPKTINEALDGLVGKVAVLTQADNSDLEHQTAVMNQIENYRKSISGVNLEEEAINMMQYQTAFNASAKAMKVGDDLLQTILSLK